MTGLEVRQWTLLPLMAADGTITLDMPRGARLLTAREQGSALCLWAEVDPTAPVRPVHFRVTRTGDVLAPLERRRHIGTGVLNGDALILHVFVLGSDA